MKNKNLTPFPMPTRQTAVTYLLTVTDTHGHEYVSVSGSLLHCLEIMGDRTYCFKDGVDTYSRIRRELVASGGAYSRFFPSSENDKLPIHLVIINEALLPAKQVEHIEPIAPRGPLLPSVQKAIDKLSTSPADNVVYQHPSFYSQVAPATTADVLARRETSPDFHPVECTSCKEEFLQNKLFGNRVCAACLSGERSSAPRASELAPVAAADSSPVKNNCAGNFHPTLSCDRLSTWQRRNYGCTCGKRKPK
jgi:hypothetical protein